MDIFPEVVEHFKTLLRFNTANPPGDEREAVQYVAEVLKKEDLQPQILESADKRANLVVRLKGDGSKKPLLITSHMDVVHAEAGKWKHPPFSAMEDEGCIWGRGAIDMKNMTAYCMGAMIALARKNAKLKRDLIMTVVADEETGGDYGMGFLALKHSELLRAEYALGELGGYTIHMKGKRIYPIQVGEKGIFWIKVRFTGDPGHGSIPGENNAHYKAAEFLQKLLNGQLPPHMTKSAGAFLDALGKTLGPIGGAPFKLLKTPVGPSLLKKMARGSDEPERYWAMAAMLANTVNPTGIEAGKQHNVVPSTVTLKLDCRLLPGFTGQDLVRELEHVVLDKLDVEVVREAHGYESPFETPLFKTITKNVEAADPGAKVIPILTVGYTDAQWLQKLGTICYGFTPIKLPPDINFPKLYHGHNERIPVEGFRWGLDVFVKTVTEFCQGG